MAQWQDSDGERNGLRLPQSRTLQDGDLLSLRRTRSLSQTGSISMNARPDHNIWWSPTLNPEAGTHQFVIIHANYRNVVGHPQPSSRTALEKRTRANVIACHYADSPRQGLEPIGHDKQLIFPNRDPVVPMHPVRASYAVREALKSLASHDISERALARHRPRAVRESAEG